MNRTGTANWLTHACRSLLFFAVLPFTLAQLVVAAELEAPKPVSPRPAAGNDVLAWRNDGSGTFPSARAPMRWSTEDHVIWKVELPGPSISSPIAVDDRVLTTAEPTELICVDATDGQVLWQRSHSYRDVFGNEKASRIEKKLEQAKQLREKIKQLKRQAPKNSQSDSTVAGQQEEIAKLEAQYDSLTHPYPAVPDNQPGNTTATPVSDGKQVWTVFATGIVSSHTLNGERNWMKFVEAPGNRHSTSPLYVDGLLIVHLNDLIALAADTGKVVWRAAMPSRAGTPVVMQCGEQKVIVTPGGAAVRARDGVILADGLFNLAYCSPIAHGNVCYAFQNGKTTALRLKDGEADDLEVEEVWASRGAGDHRLGSPVYYDGLLYAATKDGILEVLDAENGERVYRERLGFDKGRVDPSLVVAGGRLYVSSHRGETIVVALGREFEELARNQLEDFSSSPVFHKDRVNIRTREHLYAIKE